MRLGAGAGSTAEASGGSSRRGNRATGEDRRVAREIDLYINAPQGEGLDRLSDRIGEFLQDLTGPAIIVSHKIALVVMRALLTDHSGPLGCETAPPQGSVLQICRGVAIPHT